MQILEKRNAKQAVFFDDQYHDKQKNPDASRKDEFIEIYNKTAPLVEQETRNMLNADDVEIYTKLRENLPELRRDFDKFLISGHGVNTREIDRNPILNKARKHFLDSLMMTNMRDSRSSMLLKNADPILYPSPNSPHFMIRALSYIYPIMIIQPLPEISWRSDWPVDTAGGFSEFAVIMTANRLYPQIPGSGFASEGAISPVVQPQGNTSPTVGTTFGQQVFQAVTLRNDIVWDSTVEKYQDEQLNNGLVNYMYLQSLQYGIDSEINSIYLKGLPETGLTTGLTGLLNNPAIPTLSATGPWNEYNITTSQLNATLDINRLLNEVIIGSKKAYKTTNFMYSLKLRTVLTQPMSAYIGASPLTYNLSQYDLLAMKSSYDLLQKALLDANDNPWLDDQGTDGKQVAVAYAKDIRNAKIGLPVALQAEPISWEGNRYRLPFITRTFGFQVLQAKSIAIMRDIVI